MVTVVQLAECVRLPVGCYTNDVNIWTFSVVYSFPLEMTHREREKYIFMLWLFGRSNVRDCLTGSAIEGNDIIL